jgi:hypothetical protein
MVGGGRAALRRVASRRIASHRLRAGRAASLSLRSERVASRRLRAVRAGSVASHCLRAEHTVAAATWVALTALRDTFRSVLHFHRLVAFLLADHHLEK